MMDWLKLTFMGAAFTFAFSQCLLTHSFWVLLRTSYFVLRTSSAAACGITSKKAFCRTTSTVACCTKSSRFCATTGDEGTCRLLQNRQLRTIIRAVRETNLLVARTLRRPNAERSHLESCSTCQRFVCTGNLISTWGVERGWEVESVWTGVCYCILYTIYDTQPWQFLFK